MIIIVMILLGLCLGSFTNAWVWRVYKQSKQKSKKSADRYSIVRGRSMCPDCKHELAAKDLIPVVSWASLGGKCRYCRKAISPQYPLVELITMSLFLVSYFFWPIAWTTEGKIAFGVWLITLVCLMALAIYDLKWYILPNRMVLILTCVWTVGFTASLYFHSEPRLVTDAILAAAVGGGFFWIVFQVSNGKWLGGGDVKLGAVLGLIVGTPLHSALVLFVASVLGTVVSLPLVLSKKIKSKARIPFGPFLICATILIKLFGAGLVAWYRQYTGL